MAIADQEDTTAESFSDQLHGKDTRLSDEEHDGSHTVKSGMIGKEAAVNARSTGTADVIASGNFVRNQDLPLRVVGSSHTVVGDADGEDGVVSSPSPINTVWVDEPGERIDNEDTQNVFELIDGLDIPGNPPNSIEVYGDSRVPN